MSERIDGEERKEVEIEADTIEEATRKGLEMLEAELDEVEVSVIKEPAKKVFGFLGTTKAKVRVVLNREKKSDISDKAREMLCTILEKMQLSGEVTSSREQNVVFLNITGPHSALLIGKQGKNLDALQHVLNIMVNKASDRKITVILNVENYREKRRANLVNLALRLAEKAKHTGESISLKPMSPYDRMIIHRALREDNTVKTLSEGEGFMRKIVISPKT